MYCMRSMSDDSPNINAELWKGERVASCTIESQLIAGNYIKNRLGSQASSALTIARAKAEADVNLNAEAPKRRSTAKGCRDSDAQKHRRRENSATETEIQAAAR